MSDDTEQHTDPSRPAVAGPLHEPVGRLVAYEMDDEPTIYAATSAIHAANLYAEDTGELPEHPYPRELTDAELDHPHATCDPHDGSLTDESGTIRQWLAAQAEPGFLCGVDR